MTEIVCVSIVVISYVSASLMIVTIVYNKKYEIHNIDLVHMMRFFTQILIMTSLAN